MRENDYCCPICRERLVFYSRYPNYICSRCAKKATDKEGRPLRFYNEGIHGGFIASYADTGERIDTHTCYIDGIECYADEAYLGGIVIEIIPNKR
jgi:hypothetical protein